MVLSSIREGVKGVVQATVYPFRLVFVFLWYADHTMRLELIRRVNSLKG